jgi:hypothetical protein
MAGLIVTAIIAAVLAIAFMVVRVTQKPIYGLLTKILASVGFMVMAATAIVTANTFASHIKVGSLIMLGLVFGLIGDIVLDAKRVHGSLNVNTVEGKEFNSLYLTTGMFSFISGHIVYLVAICLIAGLSGMQVDLLVPLLVSGGIGLIAGPITIIVSEKGMKANFGKHRLISAFYGGFLIGFTVLSLWLTILNTNYLLFFLGMLFFLASDLVLSQNYFVKGKSEDKLLVVINHATYYAAQILIAAFMFKFMLGF